MIVSFITLTPDLTDKKFSPTTFHEYIGRRINAVGLDPRHEHHLVAVEVAEDGSGAVLSVETVPPHRLEIRNYLTVVYDAPHAHVRAVHADTGEILTEGRYHAPLQPGQEVLIAGVPHQVVGGTWPGRNRESGVNSGGIDWQEAQVRPIAPRPPVELVDERDCAD